MGRRVGRNRNQTDLEGFPIICSECFNARVLVPRLQSHLVYAVTDTNALPNAIIDIVEDFRGALRSAKSHGRSPNASLAVHGDVLDHANVIIRVVTDQ